MKTVLRQFVIAAALLTGAASAAPAPDQADTAIWNGVWAPEPRGPGRAPPRSANPRTANPSNADNAIGGTTMRLGGPPPMGGGRSNSRPGMEVSEEEAAMGLGPADMMIRRSMTAEGRRKFDQFDPLDLPSANCMTSGLPGIAVIPELQEWTVTGDELVIRHESYDVERRVSFLRSSPPEEAAHTVLGQAAGSISADRIVIETTHLKAGWGGLGRNAPGSDARTVRETYRLVDSDTIEGEIVLSDPKYLTRDLRIPVVLKRQPAGTEIESFPCDIEVARRHLEG